MSRLIADGRALVAAALATVEQHHVRLEAENHQYWKGTPGYWQENAAPILGVTEVLHQVGIIDDRWFAEEHAERGTRVHALVRADLATPRPKDEVLAWWGQDIWYGQSFRAWWNDKQPVTLATELLVYYPLQDYAGTLDWVGVLDNALWVLDWKSSLDEAKWHPLQTAAYAQALTQYSSWIRVRRGCVYLSADGAPAKFRAHYRPTDKGYFQSALNVARFKQHG